MKPLSKPKPSSAVSGKKEALPANYVHENIIRAENIKKENFHLQKNRNENYQLNPFTFYPHYEKPTKVNPWYLKHREEELKKGLQKSLKEDTYLECYTDDPVRRQG